MKIQQITQKTQLHETATAEAPSKDRDSRGSFALGWFGATAKHNSQLPPTQLFKACRKSGGEESPEATEGDADQGLLHVQESGNLLKSSPETRAASGTARPQPEKMHRNARKDHISPGFRSAHWVLFEELEIAFFFFAQLFFWSQ